MLRKKKKKDIVYHKIHKASISSWTPWWVNEINLEIKIHLQTVIPLWANISSSDIHHLSYCHGLFIDIKYIIFLFYNHDHIPWKKIELYSVYPINIRLLDQSDLI